MDIPQPPFHILALAPLSVIPENGFQVRTIRADAATLDEALADLAPRLTVPVPRELCPQAELTLTIGGLKSFRPENIVRENDYLRSLVEARDETARSLAAGESPREISARLRLTRSPMIATMSVDSRTISFNDLPIKVLESVIRPPPS